MEKHFLSPRWGCVFGCFFYPGLRFGLAAALVLGYGLSTALRLFRRGTNRQERQAIGENKKPDRNSACRLIRQSNKPYIKFSYYYCPTSSFLCKIFKNQIRKLLTLKFFLIFEKIFELFEFRSDRSFAHVGCRRQPASSLSMRLAVKLLQSRRDGTMSNPR